MAFGAQNRSQLSKGTYGNPLPPNVQTRVVPPRWENYKLITATTSTEVVPQNVYQIGVAVFGGGGAGAQVGSANPSSGINAVCGGAGGGFAFGIIDVIPGQTLPTITIGAGGTAGAARGSSGNGGAGGTSSFGTVLTATGGAGGTRTTGTSTTITSAGGTGTAEATLRGVITASGGYNEITTHSSGNFETLNGGSAAGSFYGTGGYVVNNTQTTSGVLLGGAGIGGGNVGRTTSTGTSSGGAGAGVANIADVGGGAGSGTVAAGATGGAGFTALGGTSTTLNGQTGVTNVLMSPWIALAYKALDGGGGYSGVTAGNGGAGAGGGGNTATAGNGGIGGGGGAASYSANTVTGGTSVAFGGGGCAAASYSGNNTFNATGGSGGIGGGGGGAAFGARQPYYGKAGLGLAGNGGAGLVILYWTEGY